MDEACMAADMAPHAKKEAVRSMVKGQGKSKI